MSDLAFPFCGIFPPRHRRVRDLDLGHAEDLLPACDGGSQ